MEKKAFASILQPKNYETNIGSPKSQLTIGRIPKRIERTGSNTRQATWTKDRRSSSILTIDRDFDFDEDLTTDEIPKRDKYSQQELYLKACKRNNVNPSSILLTQLEKETVELKHKTLTTKDIMCISIPLLSNAKVLELNISENQIGDKGMEHIADLLCSNVFIAHLDVSDNLLSAKAAEAISWILENNKTLKVLNISGNQFKEADGKCFLQGLQANNTLKNLNLSHNQFREDGGVFLGHAIAKNDSVHTLDLSWNHLRLKGADGIAKGLAQNDTLVHLDVSWNGFTNHGAIAMAEALKHNTTLKYLSLANNRISVEGAEALSEALAVNTTLEVLKLQMNPLTTWGAICLLKSIKMNEDSSIYDLDLSDVPVTYDFAILVEGLQASRRFDVKHGKYVGKDDIHGLKKATEEFKSPPFHLLMAFVKVNGLRIWDLFSQFDKDQSMSISRDEFKKGIESNKIPLDDDQLTELMNRLDKDGDGQIDFGEMVLGHKEFVAEQRHHKVQQRKEKEKKAKKSTLPPLINAPPLSVNDIPYGSKSPALLSVVQDAMKGRSSSRSPSRGSRRGSPYMT